MQRSLNPLHCNTVKRLTIQKYQCAGVGAHTHRVAGVDVRRGGEQRLDHRRVSVVGSREEGRRTVLCFEAENNAAVHYQIHVREKNTLRGHRLLSLKTLPFQSIHTT